MLRTSKIQFKDVLEAIEKYAFVSNPYPLILSFETHCSPEQQEVMASLIHHILGDKLIRKDINEELDSLPSPKQLMNKILIKVLLSFDCVNLYVSAKQ